MGATRDSEPLHMVTMCIELGPDSKSTGPKAFWDAFDPFTDDFGHFAQCGGRSMPSSSSAAALSSLSSPGPSSSLAALPSQLRGWMGRKKDALVGVVGPLGLPDRSILALGPE